MEAAPFSAANYFPQRRRAAQACAACSKRKTRCDAVKPKCSWCRTHNLDCVFLDSQQPRIDTNTSVLLERIQLLEDRLFSTPLFIGSVGTLGSPASSLTASGPPVPAEVASAAVASLDGSDLNAQIPTSHTANANYVYEWPIVRQLLSQNQEEDFPTLLFAGHHGKTTDVFFRSSESPRCLGPPPESWRLFRDGTLPASTDSVGLYQTLLCLYFEEAQMFFPLLSFRDLSAVLEEVVATEHPDESRDSSISASQYCLLLLVLALASLVASGKTLIRLDRVVHHHGKEAEVQMHLSLSVQLWGKAALLLGYVSTQSSLEAAQCSMLASLYHGASGRVSESFHWAHVTATKCEIIARSTILNSKSPAEFADPFRRLYWISFIWEGDFVSELSVNLPSGIARYEDVIPYPTFDTNGADIMQDETSSTLSEAEQLVAFQISTNASIRRFLNRVNSVVYDIKEQSRMSRANYVDWLLRTTEDLWSHHSTVYRHVPDFLLQSAQTVSEETQSPTSPSTPGFIRRTLGNNPWNILRLKGRYYSGQYIIHRPFIEYVLLNVSTISNNPKRAMVLDKCRACLDGCGGFIKVFSADPANSITCLFAAGMVTFTMVIILRVATICPAFRDILPQDIGEAISLGKLNLKRFSISVPEFDWHLRELDRLEAAAAEIGSSSGT